MDVVYMKDWVYWLDPESGTSGIRERKSELESESGSEYIYLAGPISDVPNYKETFAEAAALLREEGYQVYNPAEINDGGIVRPWEWYMKLCIPRLCRADAMYILPGGTNSKGVRFESLIAQTLGIPMKLMTIKGGGYELFNLPNNR